MAEGLRYVLGNPILRGIVATATTHNLGSMMVNTLYLLFAYRQLGLSPGVVGGLFAMGGLGSLAGALMSSTVTRLLGVGPTLVVTQVLTGIAYLRPGPSSGACTRRAHWRAGLWRPTLGFPSRW